MKVIFARRNSISSWVIRLFTWSDWSHCGVVVGNNIYEATAKDGVVLTPFFKFNEKYKEWIILELPSKGGWQTKLHQQLGKKYDWWAIVNFLFRRNWQECDKWFCSEYIAYASGVFNNKYVSRITPQNILMVSHD